MKSFPSFEIEMGVVPFLSPKMPSHAETNGNSPATPARPRCLGPLRGRGTAPESEGVEEHGEVEMPKG